LAEVQESGGAGGEAGGGRGLGWETLEMTTRTHFSFRIDTWTPDGENIVEHVAGVEDYQVALLPSVRPANAGPARPSRCGRAHV
jgi:hypothetical protein